MPLILGKQQVQDVYSDAVAKGWVLPAFDTENQTTTEAVLAATKEFGDESGRKELPIIVAITNTYWHRPQTVYYTHTRDWRVGMRMFLDDVQALTAPGSPYAKLRVMVHLDHIQWDADAELLGRDQRQFSSVMYDASTLPIDENIVKTAAYVARWGKDILIEGACDEIGEASESAGVSLTSPELAERYQRETGVDLIVVNLGTEHRASAATLQYHGDLAREITRRIGPRLCLHGTSSVPPQQVARLFDDGVRKVNIWTALERDSTPALLQAIKANEAKLVGPKADVNFYTTTWRQDIVFREMKRIVKRFLKLWYV